MLDILAYGLNGSTLHESTVGKDVAALFIIKFKDPAKDRLISFSQILYSQAEVRFLSQETSQTTCPYSFAKYKIILIVRRINNDGIAGLKLIQCCHVRIGYACRNDFMAVGSVGAGG